MAAKVKVDQIETVDGTGNITINNSVTMAANQTLPAASLTGTLPAISGANLTNLDAADVSGTHTSFTSTGIDDNADATAITITSAENVGIGTTSPTAFGGYTNVAANNSSGSMFELMVGGTRTANIQTSASITNIQTRTNIPIAFDINSSEKMRLTGDGLTFNGDTAAANALDDYEEGTFTPTVSGASSHSQQLGLYTKVGNLVSVFIKIECAISSGTCWVSGLPFTNQNTSNHYPTGSFFGVVGVEDFGDGNIAPQIAPGGTIVQLYVQDNSSSANYDSFGAAHVASTVNFSISVVYAT